MRPRVRAFWLSTNSKDACPISSQRRRTRGPTVAGDGAHMFLGGASSAIEFYNMHVGVVNWRLGGQQSVPSAATSTTMTSTMMCVYSDWTAAAAADRLLCTRQYGADFPLEARGGRPM